jgi:hypothetical protein
MVSPVSRLANYVILLNIRQTLVPADDPRSVIVEFARRLDVKNVPLRQLGIQFVQIGDDADAAEALKELDDQLGPDHGVRVSSRHNSQP